MSRGNDGNPQYWLDKFFLPFLVVAVCVNIAGLFVTILEPDGALYASIAKTIAQSGDFVNLKVDGQDWLDKPHLPFWAAAISYNFFGFNSFAYKFPAFLCWAMGGWYTYRFSVLFYGKHVATLAVLLYTSAAHLVISNNDVRAEPYLTGFIIASIYHFACSNLRPSIPHIIMGSLFAAFAIMTKGPFVLITIGSGFCIQWVVTGKWNEFRRLHWWLAVILTALFILPELYCLYQQFDAHPEKLIFGKQHVSGIRFFFWDSQFGRFFNTGPIKGNGNIFFYFHTLLWAFLPWSLLFFISFGWKVMNVKKREVNPEFIGIGSMLITFLLFSFSRFQLPHYINIIFPFCAIVTAQYMLAAKKSATANRIKWVQVSVSALLIATVILLAVFFGLPLYTIILFFAVCVIVLVLMLKLAMFRTPIPQWFWASFFSAMLVYFFLNTCFYPALLRYQSGSEAAFYVNGLPDGKKIATTQGSSWSFNFYLKRPLAYYSLQEMSQINQSFLVFASRSELDSLRAMNLQVIPIKSFPHFHISQLSGKFVNHTTRSGALTNFVLADVHR